MNTQNNHINCKNQSKIITFEHENISKGLQVFLLFIFFYQHKSGYQLFAWQTCIEQRIIILVENIIQDGVYSISCDLDHCGVGPLLWKWQSGFHWLSIYMSYHTQGTKYMGAKGDLKSKNKILTVLLKKSQQNLC